MKIEKTSFGGWTNCYRLSNDNMTLVALADVGPRIIHFGPNAEQNCFYVDPATLGMRGGDNWRLYGGHRFWHAPEAVPRTYQPDNQPVEVSVAENGLTLTQAIESATGVQKQIDIQESDDQQGVTVIHRLTNHNLWPVTLSPWALSVMASGGVAILPLPPRGSHDENLLPTSSLVLWAYVEMNDPRYLWGREFVLLRQDRESLTPQKIGLTASRGWVAYAVDNMLFVKMFDESADAPYPDQGCAVELYTDPTIMELETLGELTTLEPGASASHTEHWYLWTDVPVIETEEDVQEHVLPRTGSVVASS